MKEKLHHRKMNSTGSLAPVLFILRIYAPVGTVNIFSHLSEIAVVGGTAGYSIGVGIVGVMCVCSVVRLRKSSFPRLF